MRAAAPALAAALALSACAAGLTVVQPVEIVGPYISTEPRAIVPAMPLEVRGTPPDDSPPEAVAAAMRVPISQGGRPMELLPPGDPGPGPRVVVVFRGGVSGNPCLPGPAPPRPAAEDPGPLTAALAFCRGDRILTRTTMRSGATRGPSDAEFGRAMDIALRELLTTRPWPPPPPLLFADD